MDEIKRVPLKNREVEREFISGGVDQDYLEEMREGRKESEVRQSKLAEMYNEVSSNSKITEKGKGIGIWQEARTPNSFNVNAQQALSPFINLSSVSPDNPKNVTFFDIEAIGTPKHMQRKDSMDLFAMTELSLGGTTFDGKSFAQKQKILSIAVAPGPEEYARLKAQINQLKKNPLAAINKDFHRTMLDLTKYSDAKKFEKVTDAYGNTFTGINGHANIPAANSALTRNLLDQAEQGLNNLYNATPVEKALNILQQNVERTNSVLGGYNIHKYDLPALKSIASGSALDFIEKSIPNSLDFYHAYAATTKNPYQEVGGSLRQEHIHQYLINKNLVPRSKSKYLYHLAADDIQANIEIASYTTKKVQDFIGGANKSTYEFSPEKISTQSLKVGDELFSFKSGRFDHDKHRYNLVGTMEDGKLQPRWKGLDTATPTNESFIVAEFLNGVALPDSDKTGYGVRLDSKDVKGKSVLLVSDTLEDLAQQIHHSFSPLNETVSEGLRNLKVKHEQPTREYSRMFEDQGWSKMHQYYGYLRDGKQAGIESPEEWSRFILDRGGSEELSIKFPYMIERMEAERTLWGKTAKALQESGLDDRQKSLALSYMKESLDELGKNEVEVSAPGNKFFNFSFGSDEYNRVLNARDTDSIKNAFRSFVTGRMTGERVGDPEKSFKKQKVNELAGFIIDQFGLDSDSKQAHAVEKMAAGMMKEIHNGGKIETALTSMANLVREQVEEKGTESFRRETTSSVTRDRLAAIEALQKNLPTVLGDSISLAQKRAYSKDALINSPTFNSFLDEQDARIRKLFDRNFGMHGLNSDANIQKAANSAARYKSLVGDIIENYSYDFHVEMGFFDAGGGSKNPLLILSDKKKGVTAGKNQTYEELMKNPHVAVVELPTLADDLNVSWGSNKKASVVKSSYSKKHGTRHSITAVEALEQIKRRSRYSADALTTAQLTGDQEVFQNIQRSLQNAVSNEVSNVPMSPNRKLSHYDDTTMLDIPSAIAGRIRSSRWDVTGFAEKWYEDNYKKFGFHRTPDQVREQARDKGVSFFDALYGREKSIALSGQEGLMGTVANVLDAPLVGSMFGINNRAAGKGYIGTAGADARAYMALGNYYSDSVENPHKTGNYRKLSKEHAINALSKSGRLDDYRYLNSFISDKAYDIQSETDEWRGLSVKSSFMTDEEISKRLKSGDKINEYKQMIDKSDAPEHMKRQMKRSLEMGMLSSSEGLLVMDYELMGAFDAIDEVRLTVDADEILLNNTIEKAIEDQAAKENLNVADGSWKKTGIQLSEPVSININDLLDSNDKATIGEYTKNGIKNSIATEKHFRKGDKVSVLGFNVDEYGKQTLVMGRERKTGHGHKIVTESGFRGTSIPMLKEVIADIAGNDAEMIVSYLSEKKGTTDLPALIRGYDLSIREKYGEGSSEVLGEFYKDVKDMLGIDTKLETTGQYTVSSTIGLRGESIDYSQRLALSDKWKNKLGLENEVFAEIVMSHNVWDRQGGLNNAKVTVKELTQLEKAYERIGIDSGAHLNWLSRTVLGEDTTPEVKEKQKLYKEVTKAALNYEGKTWKPKSGDIVVDYTGHTNAPIGDINAELDNGVIRLSKDAFEPVPKQAYTVGDYQNTVINAGATEYLLENGMKGKIADHISDGASAAYMRLPEWAQHQYIPLVNSDSMDKVGYLPHEDRRQFLNETQASYARIARGLQEHEALTSSPDMTPDELEKLEKRRQSIRNSVNKGIDNLIESFESITSNKGMAEATARRLEMSSQYQFGSVNPLLAYEKKDGKWVNTGVAKEGHIYMNRQDVRNLVGENAENFAKSWGLETKGKTGEDLIEFVLDNWNKNDTYAMSVRYPSIDSSTVQSMKLKIDDSVGRGQVVGLRGMAERIAGDFDGDNLATFLSHYGIQDDNERSKVLENIKRLNESDYKKNMLYVDKIMGDMEADFRMNLSSILGLSSDSEEVLKISDEFFSGEGLSKDITIGKMSNEEIHNAVDKAIAGTSMSDTWGVSKNSYLDSSGQYTDLALIEHERSILARATSTTIGSVDNTRMKLSAAYASLAKTRLRLFENSPDENLRYTRESYLRETAMVDEFLREFSQKSISAKKTEGGSTTNAQTMDELFTMIKSVNSPGSQMSYDNLAASLSENLFKDSPFLEVGDGAFYSGSKEGFIRQSLELLGDAEEVFRVAGSAGYSDASLMLGASQGIDFDNLSSILQKGQHIPEASEVVGVTGKIAKELGAEQMEIHAENYEKAIERIYINKAKTSNSILNDGGTLIDVMNSAKDAQTPITDTVSYTEGKTIKEGVGETLGDMASTFKKSMGGSAAKFAGVGAAAFGGLWATNALMKDSPTPEGLKEMAPVPTDTLIQNQPTARVVENDGEYVNIQINARNAGNINPNDIAALVNNEVMAMSNMQMQTNVNINDNTQSLDNRWLEDVVANAMTKGYAY